MKPKTFVLVSGIWHGGWCWSRVAEILRGRGHRVSAPTQTGFGERAHLLSSNITLETFVEDIAAHLRWEDLNDVVLVGHSFGGATITGAADREGRRIAKLVYLDAIALNSNEAWFDLLARDLAEDRERLAMESSGGLSLPVAPVQNFGVTRPDDITFLESRLTPHPFLTLKTGVKLKAPVGNNLPCAYIHCNDPPYPPAEIALERARKFGWPVEEIASGHDAMVCEPLALAELLEQM